jgi:2-oxoisovalerate dehydrogenase E1 component
MLEAFEVASKAIDFCRTQRKPVFLHFKVVRMLGHAGSDFEFDYRSLEEIESSESADPLLKSARMVLDMGLRTKERILERYEEIRAQCLEKAERAITRPRLQTAAEVMRPLAPYSPDRVRAEATRTDWHDRRLATFGTTARLPENSGPRHLAVQLNQTLFDLMSKYPESIVFGEDIARKGGVYHVTTGLQKQFKARRVFNTLLDEQ